ncbi:hypothetical protein R1flu_003393 [Riccia fluitans]|uniref:Uncharacterized protein n=1 Tax=Riccia fluitans TaxID=41844 RepID=A0ABD1Y8V7_9MARC
MNGGSHSPNLGLLDQEASMENIDRLVEALEMEARESKTSKCRKLFSDEPSNSTLQVYQLPYPEEPSSSALQAIVRIVCVDFLAKQAIARHEHEPLLLEARNAFTNTKAEWDNEKGELAREREALREELNKAKEMAVDAKEMATEAEQRTEAIRLEKEALQQQYTKEKVEWETKNTQLIEEVGQLHEEKKRNAAKEG